MPSIASTNCHMISGRSGLPKFRQLVAPIGVRAGARDVARRLGDRQHRAAAGIEVAVAAVAVDRHRQRARRALHAHDAGAHAGEHNACWSGPCGRTGGRPSACWRWSARPSSARNASRRQACRQLSARSSFDTSSRYAGPRGRAVVDGRLVDQRAIRNLGDDLAVILHPHQPVVGDVADVGGVEVPLLEDRARPRPRALS